MVGAMASRMVLPSCIAVDVATVAQRVAAAGYWWLLLMMLTVAQSLLTTMAMSLLLTPSAEEQQRLHCIAERILQCQH